VSKRKLLLADDSVTIQKVVNLTFADEGIEVITVGDGDSAMRKFNETLPDLVLADVNMPGLNGYEICETIKQDEKTKRIPVILLVGSFEPFNEEKARRVGADDFLTKPFQSIRQLVNKVSDLLEAKIDEDDFLRPIENPDEPVSSFVEALKMKPNDKFDTVDESIENLGDAGMDDEMIQTSQVGSLSTDEVHKYESEPVYQSFAEDLDRTSLKSPYNSEAGADYPPAEDWAKTQPFLKEDFEELRIVNGGANETAQILDFDEFDLLEFPQTSENKISRMSASGEVFTSDNETSEVNQNLTGNVSQIQSKAVNKTAQPEGLSPELIEAIADRVAEKLSNEVVERIVREVIVQMERRK
jgi:CheY-like chemotaxis protein